MIPTWIGMVLFLIGALLMIRGSITAMLSFVLACLLLGGSSAINLPALGGSSIQPGFVALGFLVLRIVLADGRTRQFLVKAVAANLALVVFCIYGVIGAMLLPRLFAGAMQVTPLTPIIRYLLDADPLAFSSQNITTAVYLTGTLMGGLCAWVVARTERAVTAVPAIFSGMTIAHVAFGVIALVLTTTGHTEIVDLIRNGRYAQLDQSFGGLVRIAGFFPETSAYSAFGLYLLVGSTEMWLRNIRPGLTSIAALLMLMILIFSTSTSAYLGIAGYAAILMVRGFLFPFAIPPGKIVRLFLLGLCGVVLGMVAILVIPQLAGSFMDMLTAVTINKGQSLSGVQRAFWARQGIDAFKVSWGLGIGPGSFRSSSLATAIAGSMGVVGIVSFALYVLNVLKPLRASTYGTVGVSQAQALGASMGWAACIGLIPAMVAAGSPDPGLMFALLGGLAIGLRVDPATNRQVAPRPSQVYSSPSGTGSGKPIDNAQ